MLCNRSPNTMAFTNHSEDCALCSQRDRVENDYLNYKMEKMKRTNQKVFKIECFLLMLKDKLCPRKSDFFFFFF